MVARLTLGPRSVSLPRDEPADMLAGGNRTRFDRIEWRAMSDTAMAAAALQAGEVDW